MRAEYGRFFGGTAGVVWARIRANSSCCDFFIFVIWCMLGALLTLLRSSSLCLLRIDKMQVESRMCGRFFRNARIYRRTRINTGDLGTLLFYPCLLGLDWNLIIKLGWKPGHRTQFTESSWTSTFTPLPCCDPFTCTPFPCKINPFLCVPCSYPFICTTFLYSNPLMCPFSPITTKLRTCYLSYILRILVFPFLFSGVSIISKNWVFFYKSSYWGWVFINMHNWVFL